MSRSLFATMTVAFGVMLIVFAALESMALAEFEVDPDAIISARCNDPQNQCRNRKSGDPETAAACDTRPEPCVRGPEAIEGDECSCEQYEDDNTKCYCKIFNPV